MFGIVRSVFDELGSLCSVIVPQRVAFLCQSGLFQHLHAECDGNVYGVESVSEFVEHGAQGSVTVIGVGRLSRKQVHA